MISFGFDNKIFELEFFRKREEVDIIRRSGKKDEEPKIKKIQSKYPYTVARLFMSPKTGGTRQQLAYAKVGCSPRDHYTNAAGRLHALKVLTRYLQLSLREDKATQQALCGALWTAYKDRNKKPVTPASKHCEATV